MKIDFDYCFVCHLIYVTTRRTVDLLLLPTWKFVLIDYLMIHPYVISLMIYPHGSLLMILMILEQAVTAAKDGYYYYFVVAVEIEMMIEADDEMV